MYLGYQNEKIKFYTEEKLDKELYNLDDEMVYTDDEYVLSDDLTEYVKKDAEWEEEQKQKRKATFEKEFFQTSLGWIRRAVNMADGSTKDFLSDLLPTISMAVQMGSPVTVIAYNEPPFDEDITDWKPYQHQEVVTAQFIRECFEQLQNDFLPRNEEE